MTTKLELFKYCKIYKTASHWCLARNLQMEVCTGWWWGVAKTFNLCGVHFSHKHFLKLVYLAALKEISPRCSLEGMILKLKLQYFGHLMRRVDSLEKTDAGRDSLAAGYKTAAVEEKREEWDDASQASRGPCGRGAFPAPGGVGSEGQGWGPVPRAGGALHPGRLSPWSPGRPPWP